MALRGEASKIPLSNIFQTLSMGRQNGILQVSWQRQQRRFYFVDGKMKVLSDKPGDTEPLREALINQQILTDVQFNNVVKTLPPNECLGDALLERGIITLEQVAQELNIYFCELLFEVFLLNDAYFFFSLKKARPADFFFSAQAIGDTLDYDATGLLMESARREDEWRRINSKLPDYNEIFFPAAQNNFRAEVHERCSLQPLADELAQHLDGRTPLSAVLRQSRFPKYEVLQVVATLLEDGLLSVLDVQAKKKLAKDCKRRFKGRETMDIYESILCQSPDDMDVRKALVVLLEKQKAGGTVLTGHLRHLAATYAEQGDDKGAEACLVKILDHLPEDLDALSQLYEVYTRLGKKREAAQDGQFLCRVLQGCQDPDVALKHLVRLSEAHPDELMFRHNLAHLQVKTGDKAGAVETLKGLATFYRKTGALPNLKKVSDTLGAIDPEAAKPFRSALVSADVKRENRMKTFRRGAIRCTAALLLVGLAVGAVVEVMAYRELAHAEAAIKGMMDKGHLIQAKLLVEEHIRNYQYSTTKLKYRSLLTRVEDAMQKQARQLNRQQTEQVINLKAAMAKAKILKSQGKWVAALDILKAAPTDTLFYDQKGELESFRQTLEQYMNEAHEIASQSVQAEEAQKWRQVFWLRTKLLTSYPFSEAAGQVLLPLKVESTPSNAKIYFNEKHLGTTPHVIHWSTDRMHELTIKKPSYEDYTRHVSLARQNDKTGWSLTVSLKKRAQWQLDCDGVLEAGLLSAAGRIIAADRSGKVYAVSRETGDKAWQTDLGEIGGIATDLRAWRDQIIGISVEGKLYSLDKDGGIQFSKPLSFRAPVKFNPARPDSRGLFAMATAAGEICVFSLADQAVAWQSTIPGKIGCGPVMAGGRIIAGDLSGNLRVFDGLTGKVLAKEACGAPIHISPVLTDDGAIAVPAGSRILFVRPADAKVLRTLALNQPVSMAPVFSEQSIYVVTKDHCLNAYNRKDFTFLWKLKLPGASQAISHRPGWVYVSSENCILAINGDGQVIWRYTADKEVWNLQVIGDQYLAASGEDRKIRLFDLAPDA